LCFAKLPTSKLPDEHHLTRPIETQRRHLTFAVLVFPGFPMMAFSSVIEPLGAANVLAKRECYRWVIVGAGKQAAGLRQLY